MSLFQFHLQRSDELYELSETTLTEKVTRLGPDRYAIEQEMLAEARALTQATIDIHVDTVEPFVARGILGAFEPNWWEAFQL